MIKRIIYFLLLTNTLICSGQDFVYEDKDVKEIIKKGLDKSYNYEFDKAESLFVEVRKKFPANPAYYFLMAMNSYWKMFYYNNYKEKSKEYLSYLDKALELNEKLEEKHGSKPEIVFYYLAIHSSYALYYVQNKENLKAVGSAKKTYDYIREGYPLKEKYAELYFSAGIYDFYREQYPETHPFYKSVVWMFASGDKEKGLKELEIASKQAVFTHTEAHFYLSTISLKYTNQLDKALLHTQYLKDKYPNNINYIIKNTEALILAGKYDDAEKNIPELAKQQQKYFQMVTYVFQGMIEERARKNADVAFKHYQSAIRVSKEVNFPVNEYLGYTYQGLARVSLMKKDSVKARAYYQKARELSDYTAIRKEADEFLD